MTFDEPTGEARKSAESASKPQLELLPSGPLEEIAAVLTFGAAKYEANNWCRGARWGRYYAALLRHLFAWWRGEDRDPETGLSHLAHAGCCLLFLMAYQANNWGQCRSGPAAAQPAGGSPGGAAGLWRCVPAGGAGVPAGDPAGVAAGPARDAGGGVHGARLSQGTVGCGCGLP